MQIRGLLLTVRNLDKNFHTTSTLVTELAFIQFRYNKYSQCNSIPLSILDFVLYFLWRYHFLMFTWTYYSYICKNLINISQAVHQ